MTTLITAAKETINHDDLPKKRGTVNGLKTDVYNKISSRSWSPFNFVVLFMATKMESQNKISVEMVSSTFKKEEAGSYQLPLSRDCKEKTT